MSLVIAITLHGIKANAAEKIHGQSLAEDRYTITESHYYSLIQGIRGEASGTMREALVPFVGKKVVLTFDDGLLSDYEKALPVLVANGVRATFFVTCNNIGKAGYMDHRQIMELASYGMEIGSHGLEHRYLTTLVETEVRQEIAISRERLQQLLGMEVCSYAPVGGHFAPMMLDMVKEAGYRAFASMVPGGTKPVQDAELQFFRRNHLQAHHDVAYMHAVVQGKRGLLMMNALRYHILRVSKQLLGMETYDRMKQVFLKRGD